MRVVNSPRSDRVSSEYTSSWLAAVSLLFFRRQPRAFTVRLPQSRVRTVRILSASL